MYGDQGWYTSAFLILAAYRMTGTLWCTHRNINTSRCYDLIEVDGEAMGKHQHVSLFQVWLDILLINIRLILIRCQNHNHITGLCGLCRIQYGQSGFLCLCTALGART